MYRLCHVEYIYETSDKKSLSPPGSHYFVVPNGVRIDVEVFDRLAGVGLG
jgi:hypothetical protein